MKPNIQIIEQDTNFCFTIHQSKTIATYLIKGQFADSLELSFEAETAILKAQIESKDSIYYYQYLQLQNLNQMVLNQKEIVVELKEQIKIQDKKLKKAKWQKILLGAASLLTSSFILIK